MTTTLIGTACGNQILDALSGGATNYMAYASLHSATPGQSGASELSGGGYARVSVSWNSASALAKTNSGSLTFTTNGSTAVTYAGTWTASTAGTYGVGLQLASSVTATTITVAAGALSESIP